MGMAVAAARTAHADSEGPEMVRSTGAYAPPLLTRRPGGRCSIGPEVHNTHKCVCFRGYTRLGEGEKGFACGGCPSPLKEGQGGWGEGLSSQAGPKRV